MFSKETATCVGVGWVSLSPVPRSNSNSSMLLLVGPFALVGLVYLSACCLSACLLAILESRHVTLFIKVRVLVIILLGVALSHPRFLLFPSSSSFGSNRGVLCSRVQSSWSRRCSFTDNI